jgi:hypothetical protein
VSKCSFVGKGTGAVTMGGDGITLVWTHELEEIESEDELDSEDLFVKLSQSPSAAKMEEEGDAASALMMSSHDTTPVYERVITRKHLLSYLTDKSKMRTIETYFGENSKEVELLQNLKVSTLDSAFTSMDVDGSLSIDIDEWPRFLEVLNFDSSFMNNNNNNNNNNNTNKSS